MRRVTLCSKDDGCCPVVELHEDVISIGEDDNLCTLKREEWEALRMKILKGEL
jgi:hypothetical protein